MNNIYRNIYIVTCMSDYRRGFGLYIGFIDHLQVVTTPSLFPHFIKSREFFPSPQCLH
jgi:hypothetical protein